MAVSRSWVVAACVCLAGAVGCHRHSLPGAETYPTITSISPQSGVVGTTVAVIGNGFDGVTNVTVGGAQATFSHINGDALTFVVPIDAVSGLVNLVNAEGSGGSPLPFYVTPQIGIVTNLNSNTTLSTNTTSPIFPTSGSPGTSVIITGWGLGSTTQVVFGPGGAPANFFVNSANMVTATVPLVASTGPITITTTGLNNVNQTVTTPTFTFSLGGATAPVLTGFTPAQAAAGAQVTLNGTGFTYVNSVTIGGVSCYTTQPSDAALLDTTLYATVPPAAVSGLIAMSNGLGASSSASLTPSTFNVVPTITSFTPQEGPAGTLVTLTGSGFMGATGLTFGGTPATSFIVLNANTVQANVAPGSQTGVLTLTASGISSPSATPFTFIADATQAPVITSLSTGQAPVGAQVTLTGSGFLSVTDVYVGEVPDAAAAFSAASDTQLTLTVPSNAQSGFISATNALGTAPSATPFVVTPAITSIAPLSGPAGTVVTINGSGFVGTSSVVFAGGASASFVVVSANQITAVVPATAATGAITVTSSGISCQTDINNSFTIGN